MGLMQKIFGTYSSRELKRIEPIKQAILDLEPKYQEMNDDTLKKQTEELKKRLAGGETLDDILPDAFALMREASWRVIGLKPFPVQLIGGIVLHQGRIAQMRTGEGKTLVATLPAFLNALTGEGVHIVTVNEYLSKHQSEQMGKVFKFLGLTVGVIMHDQNSDVKKAQYACDVVYATNNELGFDYLRDNMAIYKRNKTQRGLNFVVVDEVDSILIDEARTPLIISGQGDKSTDMYRFVNGFVRTLKAHKVLELDTKEHDDDDVKEDYIIDEKAKTVTLTPNGIGRVEAYFKVDNLMEGQHSGLLHFVNQAIRAYGIMKRDIDYVVRDGEVVIVDEFTGRIMEGRRYSDGLHQAIEAKEGVTIERESKTLATITFQNFFRLYKKISGMTGTALTEEVEFNEIYSLDVIDIPTNKVVQRIDYDDVVYKNVKGKYNAIVEQVAECNATGQPVLVGTVSIEKSELLSSLLKKRGVKHNVLNAKQHEREAEIIAQAGKLNAVTIATNMAGRGTDIMLGGNADYLAVATLRKKNYSDDEIANATSFSETTDEDVLALRKEYQSLLEKFKVAIEPEQTKVLEAGGLYIIGTERHESRRVDNQLRGRAGRQGDIGASKFFLSLEDDVMRLFGGERIQGLMETLNFDENQPIETKMLTNSIESAQKKVEGRNFAIRKSVLKFDDVMNKQRQIIYSQRDTVLDDDNLSEFIKNMMAETIDNTVNQYLVDDSVHDDWNIEGLRDNYLNVLTTKEDWHFSVQELADMDKKFFIDELVKRAKELYAEREKTIGADKLREIERVFLLRNVDTKWTNHIDDMAELKRGIYLRAYGQHDPVMAYQNEGFEMFDEMIESIKENTTRMLLTINIRQDEKVEREQVAKPIEAVHGEQQVKVKKLPVRSDKISANDECSCGSGKKYKKCCGNQD